MNWAPSPITYLTAPSTVPLHYFLTIKLASTMFLKFLPVAFELAARPPWKHSFLRQLPKKNTVPECSDKLLHLLRVCSDFKASIMSTLTTQLNTATSDLTIPGAFILWFYMALTFQHIVYFIIYTGCPSPCVTIRNSIKQRSLFHLQIHSKHIQLSFFHIKYSTNILPVWVNWVRWGVLLTEDSRIHAAGTFRPVSGNYPQDVTTGLFQWLILQIPSGLLSRVPQWVFYV